MTVAELIYKLRKFDDGVIVKLAIWDSSECIDYPNAV